MNYLPPPSTLPPGSIVWAYLRDSGGPTQGESIERQLDELRTYCTCHGLILEHAFIDEARSGGSTDGRDAFDDLVRASSKPDHAAGLLLWDFARFSRSLDDAGYYKAVLRKHGVVIHSITDAVPEGPYSKVVELIIDISNQEKRRQVSKDTASGLRRIVEQYGAMPGPVPKGYKKELVDAGQRRDGSPHVLHRWVPDPEVAPLVLLAFQMRADGRTYREIRQATNLFQGKGSFVTFFNNTVYKGEVYFSGKLYPCEPIVTKELWDKVQEFGDYRGRERYHTKRGIRAATTYLLSGLVFCQECGSPLYGYKIMGERDYYICSRARSKHDCPARHIPARLLEDEVINKLLADTMNVENLEQLQQAMLEEHEQFISRKQEQTRLIQKQLDTLHTKISRLTNAIAEAGHTRALLDALQQAEKERDMKEYELLQLTHIKPPQARPRIELEEIARRFSDTMKNGALQVRREALREMVERILVKRLENEIRVLIIYRSMDDETKFPSDEGGEFSGKVSGPEGIRTDLLIIPVRKYTIKEKTKAG
jgi:site-specific DNA recombinase